MDGMKLRQYAKKYRYVLLVLLAGLTLMLLPTGGQRQSETLPAQSAAPDMEQRLTQILGRIHGAGEVAVMLTEATGAETVYQTDEGDGRTVLISDADRAELGLVRTTRPPGYRGAVVVCQGADNASVRLAVTEAVASVTGLGMDRITVLKME